MIPLTLANKFPTTPCFWIRIWMKTRSGSKMKASQITASIKVHNHSKDNDHLSIIQIQKMLPKVCRECNNVPECDTNRTKCHEIRKEVLHLLFSLDFESNLLFLEGLSYIILSSSLTVLEILIRTSETLKRA